MASYMYISKEGLEKLKKELHYLKSEKRPELSQKISDARDFGDLKENAEYHAAKEALSLLETKIAKLEESIRRAKVVDPSKVGNDYVAIYTTVVMKDLARNKKVKYTLVSQEESDFKSGKISTNSPVGRALLGKKAGEEVHIQVPAGLMKYQILEIIAPTE